MTIIHGDNQVASRQFLINLKNQAMLDGLQIVDQPGESLSLESIVTSTQSQSLLGTTNSVFIEGFFSRRPSNAKKAVIDYLCSHPDLDVTFWDHKDVSAAAKGISISVFKKFDLPKTVWQFLDTLSLPTLRTTLQVTEADQLLGLLAVRLHQLIMISDGTNPLGLAAWQIGKLKAQAAKFSTAKLLTMHTELLTIDYRRKTSSTASDLASALEVWLITHVR